LAAEHRLGDQLPITDALPHGNRDTSGRSGDRGPRSSLPNQGADELVLPHGMPACNAMLLGEAGEIADRLFLQAG
jgi:hypothetical protein